MNALNPLQFGDKGAPVADLHRVLVEIFDVGEPISESERAKQRYGAGTRKALTRLQKQHGWTDVEPGRFDEQCAARVNELLALRGYLPKMLTAPDDSERWVPFKVPQSVAGSDSGIAALSRRPDHVETWSFGPDNFPQGAFWYADGRGWRPPFPVPGPKSSPKSGIAAASRKAERMAAWWIAEDGSVHGAYWRDDDPDPQKPWRPYQNAMAGPGGASTSGGIAAVSRRPDHLEIWWIGPTGSVQGSFWYDDGRGWRPYQIDGAGQRSASTSGGIAAVSRMPDAMSTFWITPKGAVRGAYWRDAGDRKWRFYTKLVSGPDSAAHSDTDALHCIAAVSHTAKRIDVVWITPRGEVHGAYWADGEGRDWHPYTVAGPYSASAASGVAVVSRSPNSMEAFWVRPDDNSVQGAHWEPSQGWRLNTEPIAGPGSVPTASGIAAASRTKDTIAVAWIGANQSLQGVTRSDATSGADWVVHGVVRENGQPYPDHLTVRAYEADHIVGDGLGSATTGLDGAYRIPYRPPQPVSAASSAQGQPDGFDLVVVAYTADGREVVRSDPKPNPREVEQIDLDVVVEWVVRGAVRKDGDPYSEQLTVRAFDANNVVAEGLGEAATGADGTYRITYLPPTTIAPSGEEDFAAFALMVVAYADDGHEVVRSAPKPEPRREEEINLDVITDWVLRGVVEDPTGQPLSGIRVELFDRDLGLGGEALPLEPLGEATSRSGIAAGRFEIRYRPTTSGEGTRDGQWLPDLIFRLTSPGKLLHAQVYRYTDGVRALSPLSDEAMRLGLEATRNEEVALRLTSPPLGSGGSEFDTLFAQLQPLLSGGANPGMLDEQRHNDVSFAAREIGREADLVATLVGSYRLADNNFTDVPADILYGLARCDLHLVTAASLALATRQQMEEGIKQAIKNNLIKDRDYGEITRAIDDILKTGPDLVLDGAGGGTAYKPVLDLALKGKEAVRLQRAVMAAAVGRENDPKAMWDELQHTLSPDQLARTQLTLQLEGLTGRHLPLMQALVEHSAVTTTKDLLTLTEDQFKSLILATQDVPPDLPGDTDDEKAGYWAAALVANVHQAFPTESVTQSVKAAPPPPDVKRDTGVIKGEAIRDALVTVLKRAADTPDVAAVANPHDPAAADPTFDIGRTHLDSYLNANSDRLFENIDQPLRPLVVNQLKRTQRLYRVSTSPAAMDWLLMQRYGSAFEIALTPRQSFVTAATHERAGAPGLDDAEAMMMHSRAGAIAQSVVATYLHVTDARFAAGIRALNTSPRVPSETHARAADPAGNGARDAAGIDAISATQLPSWVTELGSANYCACKECQSIYSPAAYLVTLLNFLDTPTTKPNPLDVLLARRPDLQTLKLTCENSNTKMPYVDLVNRVLESLAVLLPTKPTPPYDATAIPAYDVAGATTGELAAAAQTTDWSAYITAPGAATKYPDRAAYPNRLPFDAALNAARGYLIHLGVPRTTLLKTFPAHTRYHALTAEYLQLAAATFELITDTTLDGTAAGSVALDERYGFTVEPPDPIQAGSTGRPVWALKHKLNAAGATLPIGPDPIKEVYDAAVTTAVTNYQTAQHLDTTGKVDAATWRAFIAGTPTMSALLLPHVPTFLHRASLSHAELIEFLRMRFVNPHRVIFDILSRLELPAKPLIDWIKSAAQDPVPDELKDPLKTKGVTPEEFQSWARNVLSEGGADALFHTIVIDNPNPAACALETATIQYWEDGQTDIADHEWLRLDKLIRLWRATGWSHEDLDLAITELQGRSRSEELPATVIRGIARITELTTALDLSVPQVVLLFSELAPHRPTSLYHKAFRNRASQYTDPAFDPDWKGDVLPNATIGKQLPALQSGLRIGDADMTALRSTQNLNDDNARLTISDVSAMLRYVTLARALELNVRDLLTLLTITGTMLTPFPPTDDTWALRDFITEAQQLRRTTLNVAQLNNITTALIPLAPNPAREQLLSDLQTKLQKSDEDLNPAAEPTEAQTRRVLALLQQPSDLLDAVILILTGRDQSSTVIKQKLTKPPDIAPRWQTRLGYQPQDADVTGSGAPGALVTCVGALTDAERDEVKSFSTDSAWANAVNALHAAPRATLTTLRDGLAKSGVPAPPEPSALLAKKLSDDADQREQDIAERLKRLLDAAVPVVRDQARRAAINQVLLAVVPDASTLKLLLSDMRDAKAPTPVPVLPATAPNKPLIDDLLNIGAGVTDVARQALELLYRTQQLVDGFALSAADVTSLVTKVISLRSVPARLVKYRDDVLKVAAYARCRDELGASATRLPEVISADDNAKAAAVLAKLLNAPDTLIADVIGDHGLDLRSGSLRNPLVLERVLAAVKVVTALGVSVSAATRWVRKPDTPPTVDQVRQTVDEIRRAVNGRYDEAAWPEVAKALHDAQRDARRTALVDYLTARLDWLPARTPDGLYQGLYLQVEMSSCMKTSPIRLAIESLQTFINGAQLGLAKPDVQPKQIDREQWRVLQSQQLWRANLEVLVNPENYMLPELRDDKSPPFVELEGALLSEDLTDDAAERAITAYLEKLDAVAKLDVVAVHVQRDFEHGEGLQTVVHVFGRSANVPYKHYYRRFVVTDSHTEGWTHWEDVPLDVQSDLITAVTFERRLLLFWAQQTTASQGQEVRLYWSEYRNGKWGPKNVTDDTQVLVDQYPGTNVFGFLGPQGMPRPSGSLERLETRIDGNRLRVLCIKSRALLLMGKDGKAYSNTPGVPLETVGGKPYKPPSNEPNVGVTTTLGTFVMDGCHGQLRADIKRDYLTFKDGSVLLVKDGELKIKALYDDPVAPSTVLRRTTDLRLGEANWIHLGEDYFAFSDAERVYFGTLKRFGIKIALAIARRERAYPRPYGPAITDPRGVTSVLTRNKKDADTQSKPWAGYHNAVAALPFASPNVRRPAASQGAVAVADAIRPQTPVLISDHAFNVSRATAAFVPEKFFGDRTTTADIAFETLYDPFACLYLKRLQQYGIAGLLTLNQQPVTDFRSKYDPNTSIVLQPFPTNTVDFGFTTPGVYRANACAVTNRELFIEIPMLLAKRFRENRRFEDSLRYLKYVWDFTNEDGDYWRVEPLRITPKESVEKWITRLTQGDAVLKQQIAEWAKHPFQPHLVARMRPAAYQRYVIMETLDTLLDWGDAEFRRDTMESITMAAQLYALVGTLLGPRPEEMETGTAKPKTFAEIRGQLVEGLPVIAAEFENQFPSMSSSTLTSNPDTVGLLGVSRSLYFCIPPNQKLLGYWDTVADRLYKIRHCMNIEGVVRELPLFEPRIDPALLVRAAAQGIDFSTVIAEAGAPLPPYRFEVAWRRALDACAAATRLGSQLLGALERGDAEKLAALSATHSTAGLKAALKIRKQQEEAAVAQITALQTSRDVPAQRLMYYQFLMGADPKVPQPGETGEMVSYAPKPQSAEGTWLIQEEIDELNASHSARDWQVRATTMHTLASLAHYIPTLTVGVATQVSFGGEHVGPALTAIAQYQGGLANQDQYTASHANRMAAHRRRGQEFAIGANTAAREIINIDKQITVATINKEVARLEREQIELQIEQAEALESYLDTKFTNTKLYGVMQSKLYAVFAQFYKLAYDLAKQAERCYRFRHPELTESEGSIIQAGNWESGRKGLLAGEQLELQLRQLEKAYADRDTREFELTKHISVLQHAPMALIKLREEGSAEFDLPEVLFDLDHPGHYQRRIKSVSLTIPAVVGPYATVNATLTLLGNEIRVKPTLLGGKYERGLDNPNENRFVDDFAAIQQIATSTGQNDHGMFELNFRDERFLPFEGAGAVSRWRIDLDPDCNPFHLPDVVMTVSYTARQGGDLLRAKAKERLKHLLKDAEALPLGRVISMRHEFPTEWDRLRTVAESDGTHTTTITLIRDRFPAVFRQSNLEIGSVDVFGLPTKDLKPEDKPTTLPTLLTPKPPDEPVPLQPDPPHDGVPVKGLLHQFGRLNKGVSVHQPEPLEAMDQSDLEKAKWRLTASTTDQKDSLAHLHDILLVFHYIAKKPQSQP